MRSLRKQLLLYRELLNKAQVMQFTDFPATFQPTVQSIDTWFISRKIGMLFEAKDEFLPPGIAAYPGAGRAPACPR